MMSSHCVPFPDAETPEIKILSASIPNEDKTNFARVKKKKKTNKSKYYDVAATTTL
jgi:hypothetical protein